MKYIFIIIFLLVCTSYSKPQLRFDQHVKKFLKERHMVSGHRMNYSNVVKKDSRKAFVVEIDSTLKMQTVIMFSLKEKYNVTKNEDNSLRIKDDNFNVAMNELKKDEAKFSNLVMKKLLPKYIAIQFDFLSLDIEQQFDLGSDKIEEVGYILNYQRVYNNRIVRSANDYLTIALSSEGKLKWAEISMSDLRTTQEFIETIESAKDNEDALDSVVSFTIDSLEDFQTRQKRSVQSVIAGSAAEAYCAVKDEDKIKLHPCISYTANLILDSGDLIPTIIDAPHSLKSWREYKNGKKKHIHYVNGGAGNSMFVFRR